MRSFQQLYTLAFLSTTLMLAIGCTGSRADQGLLAHSLMDIDTSTLGANFVISGSSATAGAVGMSFEPSPLQMNQLAEASPSRIVARNGIILLQTDSGTPRLEVLPYCPQSTLGERFSRLVGMGGPTPEFWVTTETSSGSQLLGLLDASGAQVNVSPSTPGDSEPSPMTARSAILMGRVTQAGQFLTPRIITTEAGSMDLGLHAFDATLRESSTSIAGRIVRGSLETASLPAVHDFDLDVSGRALCLYGQIGLAVVNPAGTSTIVPYVQAPVLPATHVIAGRTTAEALVLAGAEVLLVNTVTGQTYSIPIGAAPFASTGPFVRRLFREGNLGVVVGDAKLIRFDIETGSLLPEVPFGYGPVVAAEVSNGKLFLAHAGVTGDRLTWIPLR